MASEPKRWNGMVDVLFVFAGGVLGYSAAKAFFIKPLVGAAVASGKIVPWETIAQWAAAGSIFGALFISVLMVANERLYEWQRINRERKQREQDFSRLFDDKANR